MAEKKESKLYENKVDFNKMMVLTFFVWDHCDPRVKTVKHSTEMVRVPLMLLACSLSPLFLSFEIM